jgi:hypothetical protein
VTARGLGATDKLGVAGDTATGTIVFTGTPPLQIPAGAATGDLLTSDSDGNASWAPPPVTAAAIQLLAPLASPTFTGVALAAALEVSGDLLIQGDEFALNVTNSAASALASSGTIVTANNTTVTVAPTGNVTGVILGPPINWGALFTVINASAFTITMAAAGTSNVAAGVGCVIPGGTAMGFIWNQVTSWWYPYDPVATETARALTAEALLAPLASPALTGTPSVAGKLTLNGGTSTAGSAPVLTPGFANGVVARLTDTTRDYQLLLQIGTPGTAFSVLIGPATPATTVYASATPPAGMLISIRLPAGFYLKWAGTGTTIANQTAIGC